MKTYPESSVLDLVGLVGRLVGGRLRRGDTRETLVSWVRHLTERYGSKNITVNLLVRRILLVTDEELSAHILANPPASEQYVAGTLKKKAMAFLAPHALTIAHDEEWQALRGYHEKVLSAGAHHFHEQSFLDQVHQAFAKPVADMAAIRQRMGQVMVAVVFGEGKAPDHLIDDIQELFAEVGARTAILGSKKTAKRDQFYQVLRRLWQTATEINAPTLLAMAQREKQALPEQYSTAEMLVQQLPHWMFTFTNSGSDLLGRALAMITARPAILNRVQQEIAQAGPLEQAATIHQLRYLEACILETGRLYPPVSQTVHKAAKRDEFHGVEIPAGTELMQFFPINNRDTALDALANHFRPDRWLDPNDAVHQLYPNLFLSGARACPGRSLILFIDKAALALLLQGQPLKVNPTSLSTDPLPFSFPDQSLQFSA